DPVPVAPDPRVGVEVALVVATAVRVVPEVERHRRHRRREHELPELAYDRPPLGVEGLDPGAESGALDLAAVDGEEGTRLHEGRTTVRATAHAAHRQVALDVFEDPAEAFGGQRRACR